MNKLVDSKALMDFATKTSPTATFDEIRAVATRQGLNQLIRLVCNRCGTVEVGRCGTPRVDVKGICPGCRSV